MRIASLAAKQEGFSVFEAFLVIVIIALIGVVGYFVGHKTSSGKTSSSTSSSASSESYFDFKDLGIKFKPAASLVGLSYTPISGLAGSGTAVYVTDSAVKAAYSTCQADGGSNAIPASGTEESESFASLGRGPGKFGDQADESSLVKQFNGFFVSITYPNGNDCAGSQADQNNWLRATGSAADAFSNSLKSTLIQD